MVIDPGSPGYYGDEAEPNPTLMEKPVAKNPVEYAEQVLGVHSVHNDAANALGDLERALQDRVRLHAEIRQWKSRITDREMDVAATVRAADPEASLAAYERSLKIALHDDTQMKALRDNLDDAQNRLDVAEAAVEYNKTTARVQSARMVELGGLLEFYAVTKRASNKS